MVVVGRRLSWFVPLALLFAGAAIAAPRRTVEPLVLAGTAVGADALPADFAEITEDCERLACRADVAGRFACEIAIPISGVVCVEHPRLGRTRIHLDGRHGKVDLGRVQLLDGGAVVVSRPPHLEMADDVEVALLRAGKEVATPQRIGTYSTLEFSGLSAGEYVVLLRGSEPLQQKRFPVSVEQHGIAEVVLSLEPFRLTGEVRYRKQLHPAELRFEGDGWRAEVAAVDGRFSAEVWEAQDFAVIVDAAELTEPYMTMRHVSPAESHLQLEVPARRLRGRVIDSASLKPVAGATLLVESDVEGVRAKRPVGVKEDGTFELPGVGTGRYELVAYAPGYLRSEPVEANIREFDGDQDIEIILARGVNVSLLAADSVGQPIANASILTEFTPSGGVAQSVRTGSDGVATVTLAEGTRRTVFVLPPSGGFSVAEIASDATEPVVTIVPAGTATLAVRATSTEGDPIARLGFMLRYGDIVLPGAVLASIATGRGGALFTSATGELALPGLPTGRYALAWIYPGGRVSRTWMPLELVQGQTVIEQTFAIHR